MLICSDGLTGEIDDRSIERMLRGPSDVRTVSKDLVRLALDSGGRDNVSVVVVEALEIIGRDALVESASDHRTSSPDEDDLVEEDTLPRRVREGQDGAR